MKLRIRLQKKTIVTNLDNTAERQPTVGDLRKTVIEQFHINEFALSLNSRDSLEGDDVVTLKELGLVSGDLVVVLPSQSGQLDVDNHGNPQAEGAAVQAKDNVSTNNSNNKTCPSKDEHKSTQNADGRKIDDKMEVSADRSDSSQPSTSQGTAAAAAAEVDMEDEECIQDAEVNRYLNEPMSVREATSEAVPQALETAYHENNMATNHDAVVILLHVLMVETGYSIDRSVKGSNDFKLPEGWKGGASYQLLYTHPMCPGSRFSLTLVPISTLMVVYGMVEHNTIKYEMKLKPAEYVRALNTGVCKTYKKLSKISRLFKDSISYPLLHRVRNEMGLSASNSLMGLITELKIHILKHVDAASLLRMMQVCTEMKETAKDPSLWRKLYLTDFGRRLNSDLNQDWYKHYKDKYVYRKEMREMMRRTTVVIPPFIGQPHPPRPFVPVYPPGFIGGDYDRDPTFQGIPGFGPAPGPMMPRPRFDPIGPLPNPRFRPGRGGGIWEGGGRGMGQPRPFGGFGPRFF